MSDFEVGQEYDFDGVCGKGKILAEYRGSFYGVHTLSLRPLRWSNSGLVLGSTPTYFSLKPQKKKIVGYVNIYPWGFGSLRKTLEEALEQVGGGYIRTEKLEYEV